MIVNDIKPIVKGIAELQYVMGGGIAIYHIASVDDKKYQLEIDLSDKHDVGETAAFHPVEKALLLMRKNAYMANANKTDMKLKRINFFNKISRKKNKRIEI